MTNSNHLRLRCRGLVLRSEQMPANQLRVTTTDRDYINEPGFGATSRIRTTVNGTLVSTSLAATSGHKSREIRFSTVSTSEESFPAGANNEPDYDGAWTVTTTAPDGTSTRGTYTDGLLSSSSSLITMSYSYDPFGRTLTGTD